MAIIRIVKDNLELDFVKETLSIRKENNALIRNFKVSHSNFPFLVVENKTTKQILGPREVTSVNKNRVVTVDVYENDLKYYGELTIKEYLNGYRKCDLKYASPLLEITSKKIAEFMPVVSVVTGAATTNNFAEEASEIFAGDTAWPDYVENIITQGFPAVKWNFPMMIWRNKFGENLEADDAWIDYKNKVNFFIDGEYQLNTGVYNTPEEIEIHNQQVPMPQIYLLSPLFYALQSIGFTYEGDFVTDNFIKKIMMLSFKNNLCKVLLKTVATDVIFDGSWIIFMLGTTPAIRRREVFDITYTGDYNISLDFTLNQVSSTPSTPYYTRLTVKRYELTSFGLVQRDGEIAFSRKNIESGENISGEFTMFFNDGDIIQFDYECIETLMPLSYTLNFRKADGDKDFHQLHPTIPTGRYLPDWTLATYLNNIKNWFNLDIDIDDLRNKLILNFNEEWFLNQVPVQLQKNLQITAYQQTPYAAFLLKHQNDEDTALWITREGVEVFTNQKQDTAELLDGKFKYVPTVLGTSELSEALEDKEGVGLIIYDHESGPETSEAFDGKTLKIDGDGGIYDVFWKKFLKFRINASVIELTGGFTKTEIGQILKAKRIYNNYQDYAVALLEYKELKQDNYLVTFKVESVNL